MKNIISNILFTGKRNLGKSTIVNEILDELGVSYGGFRTLPYFINGKESGYYLEGYCDDIICYPPISFSIGEGKPIAIKETFDLIGVDILEKSLRDKKRKIILLDEIGVLEEDSLIYKDKLMEVLLDKKLCIGVLKKKDGNLINEIKALENTLIIDLEETRNFRYIKREIIDIIKERISEE